jgi:hypothetical protein
LLYHALSSCSIYFHISNGRFLWSHLRPCDHPIPNCPPPSALGSGGSPPGWSDFGFYKSGLLVCLVTKIPKRKTMGPQWRQESEHGS